MGKFIHYSSNNKIYRDDSPDSISRVGIEINEGRNGKTTYIANNLAEFRRYKTLRGAENFMKKSGRKPVAIEDGKLLISLVVKGKKK